VLIFAGSSDDDAATERELVHSFSAHGVDGLVIVPAGDDHRYLERERDAGVPIVFLDRPPQRFVADAVLSDNAGGMRAAGRHLDGRRPHTDRLSRRPRRVCDRRRAAGRVRGIVAGDLVRMDLTNSGAAAAAVRELLDDPDPPTALLCGQNRITVGRAVRAA
jgi:LacI family transcriptional regulator